MFFARSYYFFNISRDNLKHKSKELQSLLCINLNIPLIAYAWSVLCWQTITIYVFKCVTIIVNSWCFSWRYSFGPTRIARQIKTTWNELPLVHSKHTVRLTTSYSYRLTWATDQPSLYIYNMRWWCGQTANQSNSQTTMWVWGVDSRQLRTFIGISHLVTYLKTLTKANHTRNQQSVYCLTNTTSTLILSIK